MEIALPNNWNPREDQRGLWKYLRAGGKRAAMVAHRRWGKDDVSLHFTATAVMERVGNYWHMLPKYDQARKAIWSAINPQTGLKRIDEAFPQEIRKRTLSHQMMIEFLPPKNHKSGSTWQLIGSDNYNAIVGAPPVGISFSEWALANPLAWPYLEPILVENGGWAIFIFTSRGSNHGKAIYDYGRKTEGWFAERITAEETPVFTPEQLKTTKAGLMQVFGKEMGLAMYNQEYMCSWEGAILGAYLAQPIRDVRKQNRITKVPHRTGIEVDTFWDLGIDDSMSIWFMQPVGQAYNFIDYYEESGYGLPHYAKVLKEKDYLYGNHYMPHDAAQREMTNSEIAKSRKEVAEDLGIKPVELVKRLRNKDMLVQVHIPAMRNILSQCWFDKEKCERGIDCLESYRAQYDDVKKKLGNKPVHDWASHGADAFRTFAVSDTRAMLLSKIPEGIQIPGGGALAGQGQDNNWMRG